MDGRCRFSEKSGFSSVDATVIYVLKAGTTVVFLVEDASVDVLFLDRFFSFAPFCGVFVSSDES